MKDVVFIPAGGKHSIPVISKALRGFGVSVKAIFDIDLLSDEKNLRDSVLAMGGDWLSIQALWKKLDLLVRNGVPVKNFQEIRANILEIINEPDLNSMPKSRILKALCGSNTWANVKEFGEAAIPKGEARVTYDEITKLLRMVGIYFVPVGEIECFHRQTGGHGPKFVSNLLENVPLGSEDLSALRAFVDLFSKGACCITEQ